MYNLLKDACKWKTLDFLKDFSENAIGIYIFLTSLSCFCLRGRNSRLEDHPRTGFGEAPV